jgi:hypothetical protein
MLQKAGHNSPELDGFLEELLEYHSMRIRDVFVDSNSELIAKFHYDFLMFENDATVVDFSDVHSETPYVYHFSHSDEQKNLIRRNLAVHGSDSVGIARILSRVFVKKLYRDVEIA